MNEVKERDNFWFIVVGIVAAAIAVMVMVKGSEHGKFESTAKAMAEDAADSAYRHP
ncbi:hypothetical protein [Methylovulum psychrotolerans]|jgi:hypothetical protein|uniref:hypothetical protein n=1 Tax=Methylovulum psychrotolerans TaxID=1704499 RepID=UPI0018DF631D|nr:hypothetical protein [Methylovulum psychrotolerans]MBT9096422.1 hypothetical protein [Methylovulum psychrotolerans]